MRLPIKAVVEEVDAVQIVVAGAPFFRIRRFRHFELCSIAMSLGIACRMRGVARNVGVGRERLVRQEPWRLACGVFGHAGIEADRLHRSTALTR
jgi:hypothetical protein